LAKVAVQCSADSFVVNQSLVLRINICGENRHLRQAPKRYPQAKKSPPRSQAHFILFVPQKIKRACLSPPPPNLKSFNHLINKLK
jgi:hypothetical protein